MDILSYEDKNLNIVPTDVGYSHFILSSNINELKRIYPFLNVGNIGYSVLGNSIPYIKIGNGKKEILYCASFHANEWITSVLLMKFVEDFSKAYIEDTTIFGYSAKEIIDKTSIYVVPMVNPDGITLIFIGTFVVTPLHLLLHLYIYKFRLAY